MTLKLPEKLLMRRGEVIAALGITESDMTKIVRAKLLKPIYLVKFNKRRHGLTHERRVARDIGGDTRAHFLTQDVQDYWDSISKH